MDDGAAMAGKGRQPVPEGRKVLLALPGGAGHGAAGQRERAAVMRDLALGYISAVAARDIYGLAQSEIDAVEAAVRAGELPGR